MRKSLFRFVVVLAVQFAGSAAAADESPPPVEITAPPLEAARDSSIHECRAADGSRVYSDEPCASAEAVRATEKREHALAEDIEQSDDWICGTAGPSAHLVLDAKQVAELPRPQQASLASATFLQLSGGGQVRLGPFGSAHVCVAGRELKVDPVGRILVKRGGLVKYMNDPATPQALKERCTAILKRCGGLAPGATLTTCIDEVPTCTSDPPWNDTAPCCAKACVAGFRNATSRGIRSEDAVGIALAGRGCS